MRSLTLKVEASGTLPARLATFAVIGMSVSVGVDNSFLFKLAAPILASTLGTGSSSESAALARVQMAVDIIQMLISDKILAGLTRLVLDRLDIEILIVKARLNEITYI